MPRPVVAPNFVPMNTTFLRKMILPAVLTLALAGMVTTASAEDTAPKEKTPRMKQADTDKDGVVSEAEKAAAKVESEKKKAAAAAKQLEKYDANKNGVLDPEEKATMEADKQAAREKAKAKKAEKMEKPK